jgi:hypothetical protein
MMGDSEDFKIIVDGRDITDTVTHADITMRYVNPDGTLTAPGDACPTCARVPLKGAVICPHGIALPPGENQ